MIRNRHLFRGTEDFDCVVTLTRNGEEMLRTRLETAVPPLGEGRYELPFDLPEKPGEYAATVSFRLRERTDWAEAGHEIAWGQGVWTEEGMRAEKPAAPAMRVAVGDRNVGFFGQGFSALYSLEHGTLISYTVCGREMMKTPLHPVFWRAPINNDYGNGMPARYARWKMADLYAMPMGASALKRAKGIEAMTRNADGSVTLRTCWILSVEPAAECEITVTVHPCGRVDMSMEYDPVKELGDMPVFGLGFKMDADFDRIRYYGLGPEENYVDRREGARLGIYETRAGENMTPYLTPQECGNRTGVRWAEVTDFRGRGLRFLGDGMEFDALPWTAHEIENAEHANELPNRQYTVVRAALAQMGVGGDDSWHARTHDEYLIDVTHPLRFTFSMEPKL